ncbi:MAG: SUMF1/EgtB/PvdO family nonheme iron enzyme, partial [Anaerolineae bacterium]|nr:SUMF1/EgtB/PvdO family nonheme iron enzyme [Anaerolineae bacterium]
MKKLFFVLMALSLLLVACGAGAGADAEPTAIPMSTAVPTAVVVENEAAEAVAEDTQAGTERVSPVDGMVQIFVPAGSFRMGALDAKAAADEKPDRQVTMSAFWMDKHEVTNAMFLICVQAGACEPPDEFKSEKHDTYFNTDEFADFPVIYVTWGNAVDYCSWAGKRLPTEAEWERTARGDDFRNFPWGDDRPDSSHANYNNSI